ncbi:hypothetical protein [Kiloniella sp.]|uniref:hypothetical protein n=1 Tax=Kiloniella sp. TaxID=1938587 RepID=UPI003B016ACC
MIITLYSAYLACLSLLVLSSYSKAAIAFAFAGPEVILLAYLMHRHQQKCPPLDKAAFE